MSTDDKQPTEPRNEVPAERDDLAVRYGIVHPLDPPWEWRETPDWAKPLSD